MSTFRNHLGSWPAPVYRAVKRRIRHIDRLIDRRTISEPQLIALLERLGFQPGATIMVHSSMDEITRRVPGITPSRLITIFCQLLGEEGTLLMPTFPFIGLQARYVDTNTHFDVRRTPSQVGLLTEVFRRTAGVVRSLHPTHPVAAWGLHARALVAMHHQGPTFGTTSPIYRLQEHGGSVVGLGTGLRDSFTILHVIEELHPAIRSIAFEEQPRRMTIVDGGSEIPYEFRVLRRGLARNYSRVERILSKEGTLRYEAAGGFRCAATRADQFIKRSMQLADEGRYLF